MKPIRRGILLGLVTYTVVICPHDKNDELALCRAKTAAEVYWHQYIYEPHLQPRLEAIYNHPNVASVVVPVVKISQPITKHIQPLVHTGTEKIHGLYIGYSTVAGEEFDRFTTPYKTELQKHYDAHLGPYITPTYQGYVLPALAQADNWGRVAGTKMEPYLWRAAATVRQGMREAQPYLLVAGDYVAQVPGVLREHAWEPLMDIRKTYVDPQVSKMMETVEEVGGEARASFTAAAKEVQAPEGEEEEEELYVS